MPTKTKIISISKMEKALIPLGFVPYDCSTRPSTFCLKVPQGSIFVYLYYADSHTKHPQDWRISFNRDNGCRVIETPQDIIKVIIEWSMSKGRKEMKDIFVLEAQELLIKMSREKVGFED